MSSSSGEDGDDLAPPAFVLELDDAGHQGEKGIVLAAADVQAGPDRRSPLADDDRAGVDLLAPEPLDSEPLPCAVSAVAGRAARFFMGHGLLLGGLLGLG